MKKGYTLIELVVTISLLTVILLGGTAIFYRSFRSGGVSDASSTLNSSLGAAGDIIKKSLLFGEVLRVEGTPADRIGVGGVNTREDCLVAGDTGVVGAKVVLNDWGGGEISYSLTNYRVASSSGVMVSSAEIKVSVLSFTWYCKSGLSDKMKIMIKARPSTLLEGNLESVYEEEIYLLNSGLN